MDEDSVALPLSRQERQRITSILVTSGDEGAGLAGRLATDWEIDPATRVLLIQLEGLSGELRSLRWWFLGIVVLAQVIQAGVQGVPVALEGAGMSLQVTPADVGGDDAAAVDSVDTAPDPLQPRPTL